MAKGFVCLPVLSFFPSVPIVAHEGGAMTNENFTAPASLHPSTRRMYQTSKYVHGG
jgi:hypothetical protein